VWAELSATVNLDGGRTGAADADTELLEKPAQLHDVRLAGRMADLRATRGCGGRQQGGFGAGNRRFVQVDGGRFETVRTLEQVSVCLQDPRAHRRERFDVGGDRPACRKVAAGRGELRTAAPREERTQQENRPAEAAHHRPIGLVLQHVGAPHAQRRGADAVHLGAEVHEQLRHHLDVTDARHVAEHALLGREQAGREQRQRGVLVAFDGDLAGQSLAAFNQESRHNRQS
jgi:hypothetical protein